MVAKGSDSFGHEFPLQPTINSSIITFQNTGQMKQVIMSSKLEQIAKAFKKSNASVALYAEHSLNQKSKQIPTTKRFHQRMINVNPSSLSKISFNVHANDDTPWNYPGGTALTVDRISRGHHANNGVDSSGLGRWTWIRLEGGRGRGRGSEFFSLRRYRDRQGADSAIDLTTAETTKTIVQNNTNIARSNSDQGQQQTAEGKTDNVSTSLQQTGVSNNDTG